MIGWFKRRRETHEYPKIKLAPLLKKLTPRFTNASTLTFLLPFLLLTLFTVSLYRATEQASLSRVELDTRNYNRCAVKVARAFSSFSGYFFFFFFFTIDETE